MKKEAEKFASWFDEEKAKGLVDIKFFTGDLSSSTSEHFFREANAMNASDVVEVNGCLDNVTRFNVSDIKM